MVLDLLYCSWDSLHAFLPCPPFFFHLYCPYNKARFAEGLVRGQSQA